MEAFVESAFRMWGSFHSAQVTPNSSPQPQVTITSPSHFGFQVSCPEGFHRKSRSEDGFQLKEQRIDPEKTRVSRTMMKQKVGSRNTFRKQSVQAPMGRPPRPWTKTEDPFRFRFSQLDPRGFLQEGSGSKRFERCLWPRKPLHKSFIEGWG